MVILETKGSLGYKQARRIQSVEMELSFDDDIMRRVGQGQNGPNTLVAEQLEEA